MTECAHIGPDGKCNGQYLGFLCIKDKCRADRTGRCKFSTVEGFYCSKYARFECVGIGHCGSLEEYMAFIRERREKGRT